MQNLKIKLLGLKFMVSKKSLSDRKKKEIGCFDRTVRTPRTPHTVRIVRGLKFESIQMNLNLQS